MALIDVIPPNDPAEGLINKLSSRTNVTHEGLNTDDYVVQKTNWTNEWNSFCSYETDEVCANIPLYKCPTCQQYSFWLFFVIICLLAVWILTANTFVIAYVIKEEKGNRTSLGYLKGSLAFTDLLTGTFLVCITLPDIVWTTQLTSEELYIETIERRNTPTAILGSSFYMLCMTSTLYHLVLMSYNRFAAIKWPSPTQNTHRTKIMMVFMWMLSILSASYPAWFPGSFQFYYIYFAFAYFPNISITTSKQLGQAFGLFSIMVLPYLVMTGFTIATAILIRRANRNAREQLSESIRVRNQIIQREKAAYKTLAIMELGFTVTLVPALVALALTYAGQGNDVMYIFMTYSALCISGINVLIYRARDPDFQKFVRHVTNTPMKRIKSSFRHDTGSTVAV
ncbi:uncharacterized protein LOC143445940 [Clavelina lepadiformis]|uniref:uncharacterized protein LOC143445940 n=1 Tax=Clavelina lepadiformis TaxID=159417 RepID=UPI004041A94D